MTGITADDKWDAVLSKLWRQSRFAAYFFQSVALAESENIPTLALTLSEHRFILFYNRQFVLDIRPDHLIGLLIHEMLHVLLNHEHRVRPGQDIYLCNLAQDMVINSYLKAHARTFFSRRGQGALASLELPPGLPEIPPALGSRPGGAGMADVSWESVYAWLMAENGHQGRSKGDDGRQAQASLPGIDHWQCQDPDPNTLLPPDGLRFVDGRGTPCPRASTCSVKRPPDIGSGRGQSGYWALFKSTTNAVMKDFIRISAA